MSQRRLRLASGEDRPSSDVSADISSFEEFFETNSPVLYRRLSVITGNRQEAEELMQDAFLKILERWERLRAIDDLQGYLYRTASTCSENASVGPPSRSVERSIPILLRTSSLDRTSSMR